MTTAAALSLLPTSLFRPSSNFYSKKVLKEDLWLVVGQQDRMINGEDIWNSPLLYDKLGVRYRLWRAALERGAEHLLSKTTSPWSACNAAAVQLL